MRGREGIKQIYSKDVSLIPGPIAWGTTLGKLVHSTNSHAFLIG